MKWTESPPQLTGSWVGKRETIVISWLYYRSRTMVHLLLRDISAFWDKERGKNCNPRGMVQWRMDRTFNLCRGNYASSPTPPGLPGLPAALHAARTKLTISSTPVPCLTLVKIVGPSPRKSLESRSITPREAPTWGAKSVCHKKKG